MAPPTYLKVVTAAASTALIVVGLRDLYAGPLPTDKWFPKWKQGALCSALLCAVSIVKLTTFMTHAEGTFLRRNLLFAFLIGNLIVGSVLVLQKFYLSAAVLLIEGIAFVADALRAREVKAAPAKTEAPAPKARGRPPASPKPAAKKPIGSPTPAKQDKYSFMSKIFTPAKPKDA
jgi:hypothetical protein